MCGIPAFLAFANTAFTSLVDMNFFLRSPSPIAAASWSDSSVLWSNTHRLESSDVQDKASSSRRILAAGTPVALWRTLRMGSCVR